jgi:hypothetical protein
LIKDAKAFKSEDGLPLPVADVVLICTSPDTLAPFPSTFINLADALKKQAKDNHRGDIPVILVITKLDTKTKQVFTPELHAEAFKLLEGTADECYPDIPIKVTCIRCEWVCACVVVLVNANAYSPSSPK